ncbi:hypothetical protein PV755_00690 [Streptomyces caniscabiei]|uniref:hypothetical protein n=1 Tax=Streptomyces caniscabiei TaxID=2746961 RepID=UPI0029B243E8|nr:hypothetical protein [Streptomyces caniscabiei]MDX3507451.1 hypothetical protein [Streptomyces caniscabiei]
MDIDFTGYPYARYADEIASWYQGVLETHYPDGPDRVAKERFCMYRDSFVEQAQAEGASRAVVAAAVQWQRVVLTLADGERDQGRAGWHPEWTDAYEYYVDGNDGLFGPHGPAGP